MNTFITRLGLLFWASLSLTLGYSAHAADAPTLTFEGLQDEEEILGFYNGGSGNKGSSGPNYGIYFSDNSLALIDQDAGGNGNFAFEPSPNTVAFFLEGDELIMNVPNGFTREFSFYYSTDRSASIEVFDGLNGTGKRIYTLALEPATLVTKGDPRGEYGIWRPASVRFPGTAKSVSFAGSANYVGFDNITLGSPPPIDVFDFEYKLKSISRKQATTRSDGFSIWLTGLKPKREANTICDRYGFKVEKSDESRIAAKQTGCEYNPTSDILRIDFDIAGSGKPRYFENGLVYACVRGTNNCKELKAIQDLSVYGTAFDLARDAFRFKNGSWNYLALRKKSNGANDFGHVIETISKYLPPQKREALWASAGYTENRKIFRDNKQTPDGLCYGMAVASIAQFNHRKNEKAWGVDGDYLDQWRRHIDDHWDYSLVKARSPFKPFDTDNINKDLDNNNVEALKKIAYYFVGQQFYSPTNGATLRDIKPLTSWVGNDAIWEFSEEEGKWRYDVLDGKEMIKILKTGSPIQISFGNTTNGWRSWLSPSWGHAVAATQVIRYQDQEIWYMYDNNFPGQYTCLPTSTTTSEWIIYRNCGRENKDDKYKIEYFFSRVGDSDRQNIYATPDRPALPKQDHQQIMKRRAATGTPRPPFSYLQTSHLKVKLVGAESTRILLKAGGRITALPATSSILDQDSAYRVIDGFGETLYLPRHALYEIEIRRFSTDFPFKAFGTIPDDTGNVTIINLEPEDAPVNSGTEATLLVDGPSGTMTLDSPGKSYEPDFKETYPLDVPSIQNVNAITFDNKVVLAWDNPTFPNLSSIRIVRKKGSQPRSPTDGKVVFSGLADQFSDRGLGSTGIYHYALFAVSADSRYSDPVFIAVDVDRYSIYGKLFDASTHARLQHAGVKLLTADKSKIISITSTNKTGLYSFNGLTNGTYWLRIEPVGAEGMPQEHKAIVKNQTLPLGDIYVTVDPTITLGVNQEVALGKTTRISWDGRGLEGKQVTITLTRNGREETIASNVRADQHYHDWKTSGNPDDSAQLQISFTDRPEIFDRRTVALVRSRSVLGSSGSRGGGGGGALGLFLLPLIGLHFLSGHYRLINRGTVPTAYPRLDSLAHQTPCQVRAQGR